MTWGAAEGAVMAPGQALPPHGKPLGRLDLADLSEVIKKVGSEELFPYNQYSYYIMIRI